MVRKEKRHDHARGAFLAALEPFDVDDFLDVDVFFVVAMSIYYHKLHLSTSWYPGQESNLQPYP